MYRFNFVEASAVYDNSFVRKRNCRNTSVLCEVLAEREIKHLGYWIWSKVLAKSKIKHLGYWTRFVNKSCARIICQ